jgi:hypothetical protein
MTGSGVLDAATQTKNLLIHGVPGSGKSYVAQYLNLYAISKELRLVPTSIMGVRATNLGGEHISVSHGSHGGMGNEGRRRVST